MLRLASIALVGLVLGGCLQGIGDRCQVTGDCQDNLVCVLPSGATAVTGGTCQRQATADSGAIVTMDFQAPPDQATPPDQSAALNDLATAD